MLIEKTIIENNFILYPLLLSGIVSAQTIDHPPFKSPIRKYFQHHPHRAHSENTRVYIHAIFRPHWWIMEDGDTYLEDAATSKKYLFKSAEGIELKKEVYMPDSGTMDYVLVFEPLPSETQTIHFSILLIPKAIFMTYR